MSTNPSAASRPTQATTAPAPKSRAALRDSIILRLAAALDAAALRLQQAAAGQSTFANDADLKTALALLNPFRLSRGMPHLQNEPTSRTTRNTGDATRCIKMHPFRQLRSPS